MLIVSLHGNLHIVFALVAFTAGSAGVAIADVTIDACIAENSIIHTSLAADMQSLCGLSSSVGQLIGFSLSGLLVHAISSQVISHNILNQAVYPFSHIFSLAIPNFLYVV